MEVDKYIDHKYAHPIKRSVYVPIKKRHVVEQATTLGICLSGACFNEIVIEALSLWIDANINEYNDRYDDWPEDTND